MKLRLLPLAVAALVAVPIAAAAEQTRSLSLPGLADPLVTGGIRAGWMAEGGRRLAGLELQLAPGWKTYWRAPGDAGIAPLVDWSGSENLRAARILWPKPEVFTLNGMRTLGYSGGVVLPVEVTPRDPSRPVHLHATLEIGVCRDVCVPADLRLEAQVSGAGERDPAIRAALAARPATAAEAGLVRLTCRVEPLRDGLRVTATMDLPPQGGDEAVVMEPAAPGVWVSEALVSRTGNRLTAVAEMVDPTGAPFALDRSAMLVTVVGARNAVEHRGCPAAP
ncbi:MAG TPA: protein-disulfide reductase DsbD family protein [Paracoccaceae bacterium]|nr:protein-disulfide reductase DsbD family protein [Paracoccaceae bacterium]HMO73270.1 protein-disulfide reductase DsbD family protein [Paracoccaceae bacterium]